MNKIKNLWDAIPLHFYTISIGILFYFSYILFGQFGLSLATYYNQVSPIWPASGVAIWILSNYGIKFLPSIALGAFTVNYLTSHHLISSLSIMFGNTIEAYIGYFIYTYFKNRKNNYIENANFSSLGIILAGFIAPIISALIGSMSILGMDYFFITEDFNVFTTWWTGDLLGILIVLPLAIQLSSTHLNIKKIISPSFLAFIGFIIFTGFFIEKLYTNNAVSLWFFLIYFLIWASIFFFESILSHLYLFLVSVLFLYLTFYNHPLFPGRTHNENLIHIQYILATFICSFLVVFEINKTKSRKNISIVLTLGWILCGGLYANLKLTDDNNQKAFFQNKQRELENEIMERVRTYSDALAGGRSFFLALSSLTEKSWEKYVDSLDILQKYPGINGLGTITLVPKTKENSFLNKIQKEIPDFKIKEVPNSFVHEGDGSKYIITYIIPLEKNKQAQGLNLASEINRKTAAEKARDSGYPAITDSIILVQDNQKRPGFLLYIPLYKSYQTPSTMEERKAQIQGWIYAPFITEKFFGGIPGLQNEYFDITLFHSHTIDPSKKSYTTINEFSNALKLNEINNPKQSYDLVSNLNIGGSIFTIGWNKKGYFSEVYSESLLWVAVVGSLVCLLIAIIVLSFENTGRKAQEIADRQTELLVIEKEKALSASKVKSEFLANMSHEIRTPLNGIVGMINILKTSNLSDENTKIVEIISQSCEVLINLIDDVLNFSKLEANKVNIKLEACNIYNIASDICILFSARAKEKNLILEVNMSEGDSSDWIISDPLRLKQILSNLVGNALKFTQKGKVKILIQSKPDLISKNKQFYRIEVKDTGIGITKEFQKTLFRSFSQVDASSTKQFGGTGLGLSISKGLIELLGGQIWVESTYGIGSSFIFTFSGDQTKAPAESLTSSLTSTATYNSASNINSEDDQIVELNKFNKKLKILVVDDNNINQIVASMTLKKLGFDCDITSKGSEAISLHQRYKYDLILMDCYMPEMDGFEATQKIREASQTSTEFNTPRIVAVTASIMKEDHDKCFSSGMNAVILKPITVPKIKEEIAILLRSYDNLNKENIESQSIVIESKHPNTEIINQSIFDRNEFEAYFQGDLEIAIETITLFLSNYSDYLTKIEQSILNKNYKEIEQSSHALKSVLSSFFSTPLRDLLKEMELNAKQHIDCNYSILFKEISLLLRQLISELENFRAEKYINHSNKKDSA